jgi:O-antigen biosynthesis protein
MAKRSEPPAAGDELADARHLLATAEARLRLLEMRLAQTQARLDDLDEQHNAVITSSGWRWVMRYKRLRNRLFPVGTPIHRFLIWLARAVSVRPRLRPAPRFASDYERWITLHEPAAFARYSSAATAPPTAPRISLLLIADDPSSIAASVACLMAQTDPNWQLCIATEQPGDPLPQNDRICICSPSPTTSQADRLNALLARAPGEFIGVLEANDRLAPLAIASIRHVLARQPDTGLLYSDEDHLNHAGRRCEPVFKPDWSPETFRAQPYLGRLTVFDRELIEQVGGFRPDFDGAAVYDLALRASEIAKTVEHLPLVLCHTLQPANSLKDEQTDAAQRAVQAHLDRLGVIGDVTRGLVPGTQQVRYRISGKPLVSVIIPSKDQPELLERCVASVLASDYANREVVVLDNASQTEQAQAGYAKLAQRAGVRVLAWDHPFNYAAINNFGVRAARGEVLLFLNNDMQVIDRDWLERLLEHAWRPEVGLAGAKLLYADGTVQHAGVIVGLNDASSGHYLKGFPGDGPGYMNRLVTAQNLSALTGACLMMRRAVFDEVGGFDEQFAVNFNDIDLCLKVRAKGYQVVWTPHARLFHFECQTRGHQRTPAKQALYNMERQLFLDRWGEVVARGDPFYSPHLSYAREDCAIRE